MNLHLQYINILYFQDFIDSVPMIIVDQVEVVFNLYSE